MEATVLKAIATLDPSCSSLVPVSSRQGGAADVPAHLRWPHSSLWVTQKAVVGAVRSGGAVTCHFQDGWRRRRASVACRVSEPADEVFQEADVVAAAWEILDNFNRNDIRRTPQPSLRTEDGINALGASVLVAAEAALKADGTHPLLGVCAGDPAEAVKSLQQWTQALGCEMVSPRMLDDEAGKPVDLLLGPVYVKYNAKTKLCTLTPYQGSFRGVIIQIGQRQVGHLPLFLFDPSTFQGLE